MTALSVFSGLLVLFSVNILLAIGPSPEGTLKSGPCKQDIAKYCSVVNPAGGQLLKCLIENESKLSEECKKSRQNSGVVPPELREACRDDVKNLCRDVLPGRGRFLKCLQEKQEQTSPKCKEALKKVATPKKS